MALVVVHPFYPKFNSADIIPLTGRSYIGALVTLIEAHKHVALYDSAFFDETLVVLKSYGVTKDLFVIGTNANVGYLAYQQEPLEDAWLRSLDGKDIVCAGGYVFKNNPVTKHRNGCLEMVIERLTRKGFNCEIDTDAAFTLQPQDEAKWRS